MQVVSLLCWYVDDLMRSHTIPGLDGTLVVGSHEFLFVVVVSQCCEGGHDSLLDVFYCSLAHILFQLQASVHCRLCHFAHLSYIRYLCLHCVQVRKENIHSLIPPVAKSEVIVQFFS